jgi:ABC-type sugar transport system ATPase subunit
VALVPQETSCVPELSVAENLMLGRWPSRRGLVSASRVASEAGEALGRLGLDTDVARPMSALSIAETQLVDVARALARAASLVLLDEPTAALGGADVDRLLAAVDRLRSHQVGVLFVTHRLDEASAVSDRVVVFRDGYLVQSFSRAEVSRRKLVAALVGEHAETVKPDSIAPARSKATAAAPVLELRHVSSALSGGNQQKVLIASRLARVLRLAVLHEPTRGVDIGSRSAIHRIIRRTAAGGAAVLVISSDVEEVVELCDRVLVMRDGTIAAELSGTQKTQQAALHLGGGGVAGDAGPLTPAGPASPGSSDGQAS